MRPCHLSLAIKERFLLILFICLLPVRNERMGTTLSDDGSLGWWDCTRLLRYGLVENVVVDDKLLCTALNLILIKRLEKDI